MQVHHRAEERLEAAEVWARPVHQRPGRPHESRGVASLEACDEVFLRLEVQVDRPLGQPCPPRHLTDRHGRGALFDEHAGGGVEQLRATDLRRLGARHGHRLRA